jgi:hypothetical protein
MKIKSMNKTASKNNKRRVSKMKQQVTISFKKSNMHADNQWFSIIIGLMIIYVTIIYLYPQEAVGKTNAEEIPSSKKTIKETTKDSINFNIQYQDGRLTARIISKPLNQVLEELNRLTGLKVLYQDKVLDKIVSVNFTALTLEEAVKEILDGESFLLTYEAEEESKDLSKILILSHSGERYIRDVTVRPDQKAESFAYTDIPEKSDEGQYMLKANNIEYAPDEENKDEMEEKHKEIISKVEKLDSLRQEGNHEEAKEFLLDMIIDPEPEVRMIALAGPTDLDTLPVDTLIDIARNDPEPDVKRHAAEYLSMYVNEDPRIKKIMADLGMVDHLPPDELHEFND